MLSGLLQVLWWSKQCLIVCRLAIVVFLQPLLLFFVKWCFIFHCGLVVCYSRCSHRVAVLEACFLNDVVDVGVGQSDGDVITVVLDDSSREVLRLLWLNVANVFE